MDQPSTLSGRANTQKSSPRPELTKSIEKITTNKSSCGIETISISYRTPPVSVYEVFKEYEQAGEVRYIRRIDAKQFTVMLVPNFNVDLIGAVYREIINIDETPPDQQSPHNILNALNDDCLMEIFDRLSLRDFFMLAWVCKRFRSIAVKVLQPKYKDKQFDLGYLTYLECFGAFATLSLFVHCLRIFSPTSVFLSMHYNIDITLQATVEYCSNLKELDLSYVSNIDPQTTSALRSLLPKLRKLTVRATDILDGCADVDWQLEELHVGKVTFVPNIKTPRFIKLYIEYADLNEPLIFAFLTKNAQLTAIKFHGCAILFDQFSTFADCVPNVEKLTFTNCEILENVNYQFQMAGIFQRLTVCEMTNLTRWDLFLKLLVGAPLDYLKLKNISEINSIRIDDICRLTTITELSIDLGAYENISNLDLMRITSSLSGLRKLFVARCQPIMRTLRRILTESKAITDLIVGIRPELNFDPAILNDISAMIAARPELHIVISVDRACLRTPYEDWLPYANWLKVNAEDIASDGNRDINNDPSGGIDENGD